MYVGGAWWEFRLFGGWHVTEHAECLTLTRSKLGSFQLSAAVKTHGTVTPREVEAQSRKGAPETSRPIPFEAGEFSGFTAGYEQENTHWQRFWLAHGNVLVFATYNGAPEAWHAEKPEVHSMLATLRLRSSTNALPV
jgi:hypothetical protein